MDNNDDNSTISTVNHNHDDTGSDTSMVDSGIINGTTNTQKNDSTSDSSSILSTSKTSLNGQDGNIIQQQMIGTLINSTNVACMKAIQMYQAIQQLYEATGRLGSRPGKAPNKERNYEMAYSRIMSDYFSGSYSVCDEKDFELRFCALREVFSRIYESILGKTKFIHARDATGKLGIHPLVRTVACFRFLAYGDTFDRNDEYLRLARSTCHDSVFHFCDLIIEQFGEYYLNRSPSPEEKQNILEFNRRRGFPGMFASWDCIHYKWDRCPVYYQGAYKSRYGDLKTVLLEAVVDCFLYIWYGNFGIAEV